MTGQLHAEVGTAQLAKYGEELCGDRTDVIRTPASTIVVLSDGLGSGVKANILATLTTRIAGSMLKRGIALEEVVNTVAETLPVCRQRRIAYSTLQILELSAGGTARVVEFDSPPTLLVRAGLVLPFPVAERMIAGRIIKEGRLDLVEGDALVAVSDGVLHAGIGGLISLGWGVKGVSEFLAAEPVAAQPASVTARRIAACCDGYYLGRPGDDVTAVAVRIRRPTTLTLLTGPPADSSLDAKVIRRFMSLPGRKAVAGGTTANIVSRETGRPLKVELAYHSNDIPPAGAIEGIDLVTEGVLTFNAAVDHIASTALSGSDDVPAGMDGASRLAALLLEADSVHIIAGRAVNPAHQNPQFPTSMNMKAQVIARVKPLLEERGKHVTVEWH